ncbi:Phosphoinositide phosphatase SAC8 [Acorus calamus]|uniref:Phosphoinositide phosphatase SAC8 n=1 Tax=Acorus calamus TaxID=4465 RepID=A0AAV9F6N5_ACOCL|nr:Phosphoinositide phosphatase SAC8 [Acorus calamus]
MEEVKSHRSRFRHCRKMELLEFPDRFVFRSVDPEFPDHSFSVGRSDGLIHPLLEDSCSGTPTKVSTVFGVVGTIRLLAGIYVLVITSCKEVGTRLGFPVFYVKSMKFLSCNEALKYSTSQEKRDEAYFMSLLRDVESTPGLFYSYDTDLTVNLQRACRLAEGREGKPLWKQADPRFVWNRYLLEEMIECKLDGFAIPLVQGSFLTIQFMLKGLPAKITLISRRCNRRLGTRMWRRGANLEGATANFIETEQLVEFEGFRSSFLQMAVSFNSAFGYLPVGESPYNLQPKVVERHFLDLTQRYGEVIAVDLTDKHGDEGQLSSAFAAEMEKLPQVRYVSFDFHHFCGNTNFDNLQLLHDQISMAFEKQAMAVWVDHGDEISLEYSGTHALKRDLVRFGRQTMSGLIKDGMSALSRYYLNNFQDGIRQDALDLISGHYSVRRNGPSPFQLNGFESLSYLPVASAVVVGGLTLTTITLNQAGRQAHHFVSSVLWAGLAAGIVAVVKANGRQFCSRPRLCNLR